MIPGPLDIIEEAPADPLRSFVALVALCVQHGVAPSGYGVGVEPWSALSFARREIDGAAVYVRVSEDDERVHWSPGHSGAHVPSLEALCAWMRLALAERVR